jgi:hypothetical protein
MLCARCKSIKFEKISNWTVPDPIGLSVVNLRATAEELKSADCGLCQMLGSVCPQSPEDRNNQCQLRAFSARAIFGPNRAVQLSSSDLFPDIAIFGVVPSKIGGFEPGAMETMRRSLLETGFLSIIEDPKDSNRSRFRIIDQNSFDADFAKLCIAYCRSNHGAECNSKDFTSMNSLRVIDCNVRKVVDAPNDCEYAALSYVWGSTAPAGVDSQGDKLHPLNNLPKVVTDSIDVTLQIGLRYLWVDQYCIDQSNTQMKHEQICQMDLIYSNAEVTIIAVAGEDASYGLPGVNTTQRKPQSHYDNGSLHLASTLAHPSFSVSNSKWATRGWTFQEVFFQKDDLFLPISKSFLTAGHFIARKLWLSHLS